MASRVMLADNDPIREEQIQRLLDECGFLYGQPKIDGFRVHINDEALPASRSGKVFKHRYLREWSLAHPSLRGLDGEVVPGHEYSPTVFREAMSSMRAEEGTPDFTYYLFDHVGHGTQEYSARLAALEDVLQMYGEFHTSDMSAYHARLVVTPTEMLHTLEEVQAYEQKVLVDGWEGAMLRHPTKPYKYGRSTNRGGELVKLKRFETAEAVIEGWEPWEQNNNAATIDVRGYQVRSSHQEGKEALEMLGAWKVHLLTDPNVKFKIGVMRGVTHDERKRLWTVKEQYLGKVYCFKHQGYGGGYDVPRCPVGLNFRSNQEF